MKFHTFIDINIVDSYSRPKDYSTALFIVQELCVKIIDMSDILHQENNEYGVISIDNNIIIQSIKDTIKSFDGKVWLANYKGKQNDFLVKLGNFDSLSQIDLSEGPDGIYVRVYIITRFGMSISTVVNELFHVLSNILSEDLELRIDDIVVELTGVVSSKGIKERSIEYSFKNQN